MKKQLKYSPFLSVYVRLDFHKLQPNQHIATTECKSRYEKPASIKVDIKKICKKVKQCYSSWLLFCTRNSYFV